jgi:nitroimidazol reductase NimA-like FMN-containing flavoprotein (pyridoxamine 5'-phosphate oxidase superfamily)
MMYRMSDDFVTRVLFLIQNGNHMTMATADAAGNPWVTPVFYSSDPQHNLYWVSSRSARHSSNLRTRSEVGIAIFVTKDYVDGIYIEADARELSSEHEIEEGIDVVRARAMPERFTIRSAADVAGESARRIYKAVPKQIYTREEAVEQGQVVAVRRPIDLSSLRGGSA